MVYQNIINGKFDTENNNSGISSTKKDEKGKNTLDINDFLALMVAQMQYQDPLEPTDNTQYIAQMATFSQVEATKSMLNKTEQQMASELIGKTVIMKTDDNKENMISGKVDYWENIEGKIYLGINKKLYDIADLDTVLDTEYFDSISKDPTKPGESGKPEDSDSEDSAKPEK